MAPSYFSDTTFEKKDYTKEPLAKGEYESCTFINCDFNASNLKSITFIDCTFNNCNLSNASLNDTSLNNILFKECKLLGLHFESCNQFGLQVRFENCNLNHSSFYHTKLKKTIFKTVTFHESDFTGADLSEALFDNCDFKDATFDNTLLEKADFRSSYNYILDPENNRIKKARFSVQGAMGLLAKYGIEIN
jgi:fluoroquinolone resistance protein